MWSEKSNVSSRRMKVNNFCKKLKTKLLQYQQSVKKPLRYCDLNFAIWQVEDLVFSFGIGYSKKEKKAKEKV